CARRWLHHWYFDLW
nr:immunoglobulin heavy chain junction region [Macaca mulatta]